MTGSPVKGVVFTDVDGTLTTDRTSTELDLNAIRWMRALRDEGYAVILVSGNSVPVLLGLSTYLGLGKIVIAENGCVIYADGLGVSPLCSEVFINELSSVAKELIARSGGVLRESWQNAFRLCDRAFKWDRISEDEAVELLLKILRKVSGDRFVGRAVVESSGYAIHIRPSSCDKGVGIKKLLTALGWEAVKTFCIGDSVTDVPMRRVCDCLVAVSNSDDELKSVADYVMSRPSSKGFIEFAEKLLANKLRC